MLVPVDVAAAAGVVGVAGAAGLAAALGVDDADFNTLRSNVPLRMALAKCCKYPSGEYTC